MYPGSVSHGGPSAGGRTHLDVVVRYESLGPGLVPGPHPAVAVALAGDLERLVLHDRQLVRVLGLPTRIGHRGVQMHRNRGQASDENT